jgi:hypothetical protein
LSGAFFFLVAVLASDPATNAQSTFPAYSCNQTREQNPPIRKKLWDGYEISLGPARNSDGPENKCTAAIYDNAGNVVYRTTGFSVMFDENMTGKDFDGDGKPEVVFVTDTGGGMHCCWAYNVISLWPKPHKLFDIDQQGAVRFELDSEGKMVIWKRTAGPYGFTSMARTPFAEKVLRVRGEKLVDATPEFCEKILGGESGEYLTDERLLTPDNFEKFRLPDGMKAEEKEDFVSALLSTALQRVFCHKFDEAMQVLDKWPDATRAKMKADFAAAIKDDYPEFAAKLLGNSSSK